MENNERDLPDNERDRHQIVRWLFNPFQNVAGGRALVIGVAAILVTGLIGSLSNTHFDGVMDVHTGKDAPLWVFLAEGLISWLVMATVMIVVGRIVSRTRFRIIDVFGTQALARWPHVISALVALAPPYIVAIDAVADAVQGNSVLDLSASTWLGFGLVALVMILMMAWSVALMYRGLAVSCNARGGRAVAGFVVGIIVAEFVSKALVIILNTPRGV